MYPRGDKAGTDEQACTSFPQHWKREDEKKRKGIRKDEEEKRKAEEKIRKQEEEKRIIILELENNRIKWRKFLLNWRHMKCLKFKE